MRNVALFASQLGGSDFNKYWPSENNAEPITVTMSEEIRNKILAAHKLRI